MSRSLRERFEAKVDRRGLNDCHPWTASTGSHGYGQIRDGRTVKPAHRVAWELYVGPIPDGQEVDHVHERGCTTKLCVNLAHLELVTKLENVRRQQAAGRMNSAPARLVSAARRRARTHCRNGHPYLPENTHIRTSGARLCLTCKRESNRRYLARRSNRAA